MPTPDAALAAALQRAPGRLFVGFSGGLDSTVLLHALLARRSGDVTAVHVNHGLHPLAARWQQHCVATCQRWGVALVTESVSVARHGNLEAQARTARYRAFTALLSRPDDCLLLAHHRDDQVETALLRLVQGRGFYGMPAERALGVGRLLRPLLALPRAALEQYAVTWQLDWVEDPANADLRFDRNYLRHAVLPPLRARWPGIDRAVTAALPLVPSAALAAGTLVVANVVALPPADAVTLLRGWLAAHGYRAPRRVALAEFVRQLTAGEARQPELVVDGGSLRRFRGRIHLLRAAPRLADEYALPVPGLLRLPHGELHVVPDPAGFRPHGPCAVRFRHGGERLLTGGRHRSLKALLQEAGVPPWQRNTLPLIHDDAGLLAVPGVAHRDGAGGAAFRADWRPDA
jgi:tRNA(Ile)-lysidine synthase